MLPSSPPVTEGKPAAQQCKLRSRSAKAIKQSPDNTQKAKRIKTLCAATACTVAPQRRAVHLSKHFRVSMKAHTCTHTHVSAALNRHPVR